MGLAVGVGLLHQRGLGFVVVAEQGADRGRGGDGVGREGDRQFVERLGGVKWLDAPLRLSGGMSG